MLLLIKFSVRTFPLISFSSSLRLVMSDFLIFPTKLNFESLLFSDKLIFKKIKLSIFFSTLMLMSENSFWLHKLLIALDIFAPGTFIVSPISKPEIDKIVLVFKYLVPEIVIPPISYFFGNEYSTY